MIKRLAQLSNIELKKMNCKCDPIQLNRWDDFITRLSWKLVEYRNKNGFPTQPYLSHGTTVKLFLEEAGLTYKQTHQLGKWKMKTIFRELCKKDEAPESEYTVRMYSDGSIKTGIIGEPLRRRNND